MRGLALAFWLLSLASGLSQTGTASAPPSFSVCWWNLENWGETDRMVGGVRVLAAMKPPAEVGAVMAILKRLRPDILGVAEIVQAPDDRFLNLLRQMLAAEGLDYPHLSVVHGQDTRIQMALLSRFPLVQDRPLDSDWFPVSMVSASTGERRQGRFRVARGFLDVTAEVAPGLSVEILAAHLKAKIPEKEVVGVEPGETGEEYVRTQEARLLQGHAAAALRARPEASLLVMGDLNDLPESRALKPFFGDDGRPPLLRWLPLADWMGEQWTHTHWQDRQPYHERLDYMLASGSLYARFLEKESCLFRRAAGDGREFETATASDHRPLFARFRLD